MLRKQKIKKTYGFTLIELLIVIGIIGILSGITLNLLDAGSQRNKATDATNLANLKVAAQGIESFYTLEGAMPIASSGKSTNPLADLDGTVLREYLRSWPAGLTYEPNLTDGTFIVYVPLLETPTLAYTYQSSIGDIMECAYAAATDVVNLSSCN